jgi:hypothetical protein
VKNEIALVPAKGYAGNEGLDKFFKARFFLLAGART